MAKKKKEEPIGEKIKKIRTEKHLTLENLANETGCSVDFLKQVEQGEKIPPVGTLLQISRALEIDTGFFLREQEESLEQRARAYEIRTENYAYTSLTPGAEHKHLKAFKIKIEAKKEHKGVGYIHEGEEFIYVLEGKIEVIVGDHVNVLEKDDSLHFNSGVKHQMKNVSENDAELIVVVYSP